MRLILLTTLLLGAAAVAQDNLADKIVNDPGAPNVNGAKAKLFDDPAVQGGKAVRVIVARKGKNDWDSNVESAINKPIAAGDRLVLAFQAKLESVDGGATTATLPYNAVQMSSAPYSTVISGSVSAGPNWEFHKIEGKADRNYAPGELKATIQLGNAKQTVDFGPIAVFDPGQ